MRTLKQFPKRYQGIEPDKTGPWWDHATIAVGIIEKGGIVALHGPRGRGKTFMAYFLAKHAPVSDPCYHKSPSERPAVYRTAMRIFLEIRDTYRTNAERSELQLLEEFTDAALLVIDEIQVRGETEFEENKLTAIIDDRYQANRPTILIGNYETKADFANSVSPSIRSRMQESGGAILCDWPSYRAPNQSGNA